MGTSSNVLSRGERRLMPDPFTLVIFGASGDLTRRKLVPAIYNLYRKGFLPEQVRVIGFARREKSDASFAAEMREGVVQFSRTPIDGASWDRFAGRLHYHRGDFDDPDAFRRLKETLSGNAIFYMATQPESFGPITAQLRETGLIRPPDGPPWSRIVVEKPFGYDLESARALNSCLRSTFAESQIFRIDHYLGKEAVQNILVFRFANSLFEPLWNNRFIDHVQITVSEDIGVEGRGKYYDHAGALRDMVQNHMMHLLAFAAMESPLDVSADAVRDEKVKVLRALRPIPRDCGVNGVIRAQYGAGEADGKPVRAYREEEGVDPNSFTETFVAFKAHIDNWRWADVPFYLRTGKHLPTRMTQISVHFKTVPQVLFNAPDQPPLHPNVLVLRIQPNEGISLWFEVKVPGMAMNIQPFEMDFGYGRAFDQPPAEAYERLLLDGALGDSTLFIRNDELEAAWSYVEPVIQGCRPPWVQSLPTYAPGTWGPKESDALIEADGRRWEVFSAGRRSDT